ncbi:MAG: PSD1 and planctomycete cytochrome C domain-containing protein [Bryobacteraceae bacterium]
MPRAVPAILAFFFLLTLPAAAQTGEQTEFFERKIRPVFAASCAACHNPKVKTAGLDLSSGEGFLAGGQSGPLVDKTKPEDSRLLKIVSYDERLKMPPTGKLSAEQLADLAAWVKMGAPWPGAKAAASSPSAVRRGGRNFSEAEKKFRSFQPLARIEPPAVKNRAWVRSPVDQFILSKLEAKGLAPAPEADKATLLRRATYDLTGLPPTEKELAEFLADNSPDAFRNVVERLLASPRYGERWGRHWLDVARYADSTGNDEDHRYPYAWRYRDYVIESYNADVPFNQFLREQIAGDLIPAPDGGINRRGIVATGFLALGAKAIAQQDKKKMLYDVFDEQVDVTSKAILGLTLSCGRCHDHKFDPLLSRDYYAMINFFANTRSFKDPETHVSKLLYVPLVPAAIYKKYTRHQETLSNKKFEMDDVIEGEKERWAASLTPRLADYMVAAWHVKHDGKDAAATAAAANLKPEIVAKWVDYLKQDWRQKPHLEDWSKATDAASAAAIAAKYQKGYVARMEKWSATIREWRENTRRALKEMNMPPRPRPEFAAEEDGFYYDIYIDGKGPFGVGKKEQESIYSPEARETLARLKREEEELKKAAPPEPDMASGVEDGDAVAQKVFIRGDYNSPGEDAPKSFPLILAKASDPAPAAKGSGRMALAEWLSSSTNPLTPRVMANRIWQRHFAEGIVRTPDNFGKMGERPSHPELLDWLASEFIAKGWSIKQMHRIIMNSSAYRMASAATPETLEKDPENRLFSRFQRRRLDVEEIRDGLLAVDGSLDATMGGTMQSGFGTDGENSQDRLSINPEKQTRRTVYLPLRRANLPTLFNLFDFGDATTPTGKRVATNVAPQALFMMNSEFLTERSGKLAGQLLADSAASPAARIERAYIRTVNRRPAAQEVDSALSYISRYRQKFPAATDQDALQSMCRVLMASSDFIYVD